uniref:SET domain-containing protein n=1 Tax=Mesocestoides corti TaxID=53468 RepID=A0A5K3G0M0_MESCO
MYARTFRGLRRGNVPFVTILNAAPDVRINSIEVPLTSLINRSCTPNMTIIPVRVASMRFVLALFAIRGCSAGEELTYNYYVKSCE